MSYYNKLVASQQNKLVAEMRLLARQQLHARSCNLNHGEFTQIFLKIY